MCVWRTLIKNVLAIEVDTIEPPWVNVCYSESCIRLKCNAWYLVISWKYCEARIIEVGFCLKKKVLRYKISCLKTMS